MTRTLSIRSRQRIRAVNARLLRRLTLDLIGTGLRCSDFELCIHLVAAAEMTRLNAAFLQHQGSTDVITFDYGEEGKASRLFGEIFICLEDTVAQAQRFRTTWQRELARYVIHGLLHLAGYDDLKPPARREMKREENRLLRNVTHRFPIKTLALPRGARK